jgi:carboxylate-amine ligase
MHPSPLPGITEDRLPDWARWHSSDPYTLGVEEEVMILDPADFSLAQNSENLLATLPADLASHLTAETHDGVVELATRPLATATDAGQELRALRSALARELDRRGLAAACAGTHPLALWSQMRVSAGARYQLIYQSMRELARREPTLALHVHVGVPDSQSAILLLNRLRAHVPLLLALSANSPFWQGRDTGLASSRTSVFQAFPRVGIPRAFGSYLEYVTVVEQLLRCGAFPEPSFLWWHVRLRPAFGTLEIRVMDSQSTVERSAALTGFVQSIARLELEEGYHDDTLIHAPELLEENLFLAARDGIRARLLDPVRGRRVPVHKQLSDLIAAVRPHAQDLEAEDALGVVIEMAENPGALNQRSRGESGGLQDVLQMLIDDFPPK